MSTGSDDTGRGFRHRRTGTTSSTGGSGTAGTGGEGGIGRDELQQ
ncbi:MAG: hypothetical protein ACXW20_16905 [Burkholderiales bacterium]